MNKLSDYLNLWVLQALHISHIRLCDHLVPPNLQITDAHRVKERASEVFWISIQWGCMGMLCWMCLCWYWSRLGSQFNCLVENENLYAKTTILFDVIVWLCIDGFSRCHSSETVLMKICNPPPAPFFGGGVFTTVRFEKVKLQVCDVFLIIKYHQHFSVVQIVRTQFNSQGNLKENYFPFLGRTFPLDLRCTPQSSTVPPKQFGGLKISKLWAQQPVIKSLHIMLDASVRFDYISKYLCVCLP